MTRYTHTHNPDGCDYCASMAQETADRRQAYASAQGAAEDVGVGLAIASVTLAIFNLDAEIAAEQESDRILRKKHYELAQN